MDKKTKIKAQIYEWMYKNDGIFDTRHEWREAFSLMLGEVLENNLADKNNDKRQS